MFRTEEIVPATIKKYINISERNGDVYSTIHVMKSFGSREVYYVMSINCEFEFLFQKLFFANILFKENLRKIVLKISCTGLLQEELRKIRRRTNSNINHIPMMLTLTYTVNPRDITKEPDLQCQILEEIGEQYYKEKEKQS